MADSIKDRTYQGTETYGQAFDRMSKGQAGYAEAVKGLADELARLNGLSDEQRQWLEDYIKGLDNVRDSWEKINDYLSNFTDTFDEFSENLEGVRNLFTNILRDLQPARRQATEQVNLLKTFRDLTGEVQRATAVQGGTSEANLKSLTKRVQKAKELWEWNVKGLTGGSLDSAAITKARESEENKIAALEAEKASLDDQVARLQSKIRKQLSRGYVNLETKANLDAAIKAQREFNKEKAAELDLHRARREMLAPGVQEGIRTLEEQTVGMSQDMRRIRRSHPGLNLAAKLAEKLGVSGAKQELEDFEQQQYVAQEAGTAGPPKASLIGNWIKEGITFGGIMAAVGLTVSGIVRAFKEVSSEAAKLKQNIGSWQVGAAAANTEFASSVQYLQTANELVQQFGQDPTSFISPDGIARLAEAKNLLGLSAEQAGNLGIRSKLAGQNADQYNESIVRGINHGNALNRSAVAHGLAMKEVLATSDDITLSLGNSGEKLGQAIVAAKNLGMSLKDVDNIAGQLLNFETSIENEMKAQLLTGGQMNLARARGLALQNDLEGVAKELANQGMTAAKFGELNRIQQESYATALGMSREQLGRMLVTQAGIAKLTDEQVKAATGVTKEQLEAMGITERWKVATDKLTQAFTPLLEAVMPVVEGLSKAITWIAGTIGKIFSFLSPNLGGAIKGILTLTGVVLAARLAFKGLGLIGSKAFGGIGKGIAKTLRGVGLGIKGLVTSVSTIATNPASWAAVGMVAALGAAALAAGYGINLATKGMAALVDSFKDIDTENILMIGPALFSMAAGLAAFGLMPGVLFGIGKLALATKALKSIDSGKVQEASSRATNAVRSTTNSSESQDSTVAAVLGRVEKLLTSINSKVSPSYDVYLDADKVGHTLATSTVRG